MTETSILRATELFASLTEESLSAIAATGSSIQLRRGDTLFTEGEEPDHIYIVTSGRIAMVNRSIDGRESVVALMETGDLFGEMPLFDGGQRSAGARALEPSECHRHPI